MKIKILFLSIILIICYLPISAYSNEFIPTDTILNKDNTALIIIDVQKNFIPGSPECFIGEIPGQNTPNKLTNVKKLINYAKSNDIKTLVTYENADYGDAAMPKELFNSLPSQNIRQFIKTYFDITQKESLLSYLNSLNVKNVIVCGAETDVCVLQSVKGLKSAGYNVLLAEDATYTSTTLNKPALTLMKQLGVNINTSDNLINSLTNGTPLPNGPTEQQLNYIPDMTYYNSAMIILNLDDQSLNSNTDDKRFEKLRRFEFICDLARISKIPLYIIHDDSINEIKSIVNIPENVNFIKSDGDFQASQRELINELKTSNKSYVMLGGIDENSILYNSATDFERNNFSVYLLEDAFLKDSKTNYNNFKDFYDSNIIPSSVKISFYDIGESASFEENPDNIGYKYVENGISGDMDWIEALPFVVDSQ